MFDLEIDPYTESLAVLGLPPVLVSFIRIILYDSEWDRSKAKGKPPKPKMDPIILVIMKKVLEKRLEDYQTSLEVGFSKFSTLLLYLPSFNLSGRRDETHIKLDTLAQQAKCTYRKNWRKTNITHTPAKD